MAQGYIKDIDPLLREINGISCKRLKSRHVAVLDGQLEKVNPCRGNLIGILTHSVVKGGLDLEEFSQGPGSDHGVKSFNGDSNLRVL